MLWIVQNVNTHMTDYWRNLTWPAAPNNRDYSIFSSYCRGSVLLLGSTALLLPLADEAWDIDPVYNDTKIQTKDWFTLNQHWDTVIIDGAILV